MGSGVSPGEVDLFYQTLFFAAYAKLQFCRDLLLRTAHVRNLEDDRLLGKLFGIAILECVLFGDDVRNRFEI